MKRISIALSDKTVWIYGGPTLRGRDVYSASIGDCEQGSWIGLRVAVKQYMNERRIKRCEGRVQLLTPLVVTRVIQLPRLRAHEIQLAVERTPERFFPIPREPHLISTRQLGRQKAGTIRVLASAIAESVPALIKAELGSIGVRVKSIGCAHASWLERSRPDRKARAIVVNHADVVELLELDHGQLTGIRCVRPAAMTEYTVPRNGRRPGVIVIAEPPCGTGLSSDAERSCKITKYTVSAGEFSARHGRKRHGLVFRDPAERKAIERRRLFKVGLHLFASLCLLFGAGILERSRQTNELSAIERARSDLAPLLNGAIAAEQAALTGSQQLEFLQRLEADGERWTTLLTQLARHLPDDTRLSTVRVQADSVTMEGFSEQPQAAFDALRESGTFSSIVASSPVVRERTEGSEAQLRFTFIGILKRRRTS